MAQEVVTIFTMTDVQSAKTAQDVTEKRFTSLNGYDSVLRKGAVLLMFSDSMKEEKRVRGQIKFTSQYFWAIDVERNKLVKPSRTGLSGGMGYTKLPMPGVWKLNDERTWHILQPQEGDPAIESRKQWGISRLLPGAFDFNSKTVSIPKCFVIEVTEIEYLCSRNPVDASASAAVITAELSDTSFKEDSARRWGGKAYYPTREFVNNVVAAYNAAHTDQITDDMLTVLFK